MGLDDVVVAVEVYWLLGALGSVKCMCLVQYQLECCGLLVICFCGSGVGTRCFQLVMLVSLVQSFVFLSC